MNLNFCANEFRCKIIDKEIYYVNGSLLIEVHNSHFSNKPFKSRTMKSTKLYSIALTTQM